MAARAIMIQGTGSNVGKSMLVAGLARAYADQGLRVMPFKPQNMSNNAAVTEDGGEIGRAQALQARAARVLPRSDMNPLLLKPETDTGAQIILQGKRQGSLGAKEFARARPEMRAAILDSFHRLSAQADLILIEGAGSPAEVNLRENDLANMGFATSADVPVILVGDIDRGGVIAQLVGTRAVLSDADRARIHGFIVNRFRGDPSLFEDGMAYIAEHTGWQRLGLVPWFQDAWRLPAEDVMDLGRAGKARGQGVKVAVPQLNRIANFDDLDPLQAEPGVELVLVEAGRPLPGDADLVLIPGSKSTIADLRHFRAQGWDIDLIAHVRRGGHVLGLCGGYQMLGRTISDPDGLEGDAGSCNGLGLLDVTTRLDQKKRVTRTQAIHNETGSKIDGYEIHLGQTSGPDCSRAWLDVGGKAEGAASADGRVRGCYLHGLYSSDQFRAHDLARLGGRSSLQFEDGVEATLDGLAAHLRRHLDLDAILALAAPVMPG
ncbi:cobyric acid synthase [Pseudooceanicola sp. C21-150M6]|uniref:cobyric acid synthase n=1 Tax=Pseudooceanicola sp. C21-150M6 TaxID=3434355 RepID=UPI003D7F9905